MRLFVAVNLPQPEKAVLASMLETLRESPLPVRWVDADSIHITLKFLGTVADPVVLSINEAIDRVAASAHPFRQEIGGFGMFPSRTRPRVFWIGVAATRQLLEIQQQIEEAIEPLGFPREKRDFSPHLTLGRVKKDAGRIDPALVDRIAGSTVYKASISVESIDLMRSHLSPRGARYERVHAAHLGRGL